MKLGYTHRYDFGGGGGGNTHLTVVFFFIIVFFALFTTRVAAMILPERISMYLGAHAMSLGALGLLGPHAINFLLRRVIGAFLDEEASSSGAGLKVQVTIFGGAGL